MKSKYKVWWNQRRTAGAEQNVEEEKVWKVPEFPRKIQRWFEHTYTLSVVTNSLVQKQQLRRKEQKHAKLYQPDFHFLMRTTYATTNNAVPTPNFTTTVKHSGI